MGILKWYKRDPRADKESAMRNVYLAECLTYGPTHPVKVGISHNPYKRMRHLPVMGINCPSLRAIFVFSDKREARFVENQTCKQFKPIRYCSAHTRELLDASLDEIFAFIKSFGPLYSITFEKYH